jgi:hypothetical protein
LIETRDNNICLTKTLSGKPCYVLQSMYFGMKILFHEVRMVKSICGQPLKQLMKALTLQGNYWLERSERSERRDQPTILWSDFGVLYCQLCILYSYTGRGSGKSRALKNAARPFPIKIAQF